MRGKQRQAYGTARAGMYILRKDSTMEMPRYNFPVSLIPGGCPQFLDFEVDLADLDSRTVRFSRSFREEKRAGSQGDSRQDYALLCVQENDSGQWLDLITGAAAKPSDYEVDSRKCLDSFYDQWIPVPVLRMRELRHPDGEPMYEAGPGNWARCRIVRPEDGDSRLRLVLAFDTTVEDPPADGEHYFALSPNDVAANAVYSLAWHVRDNTWYLNAPWVDRWLHAVHAGWQAKQRRGRAESPYVMEYLANYLTFLDLLHRLIPEVKVRVINPGRDTPVDVDLILDIGNARTTGILVETPPQRATNLNNSYLLQIRDLSKPEHIYVEPFATRIEFSEANFGDDAHSKLSGRRTPAFPWASAVRMGPEAARLATFAKCAEGTTGMSSPKRYLWDERAWKPTWRYNTGGDYEPMVTRGSFAKQVNDLGTPISCFDDPSIRKNPLYTSQDREIAFESQFTRSSTMMFLLGEIIMQALVTINSPASRARRELSDLPRRLRRIIFTVPSGMPIAEQNIYRRWVKFAVRTVWEAMGWGEWYVLPEARQHPRQSDYRQSPETMCNWDEATCTQLVYLYNEVIHKFQGDAHHFFRTGGKVRPKYGQHPSLRVASIDVGGGTTDLSIATFSLDNDESSAARVRPHLNLRDGFNIAGDDILKSVINEVFLNALEHACKEQGVASPRHLLAECFGRDVLDNSQENKNLRSQFTRQLAAPVGLALLSAYEKADPLRDPSQTFILRDFFDFPKPAEESKAAAPEAAQGNGSSATSASNGSTASSGPSEAPEAGATAGQTVLPFAKAPAPGAEILEYVESAVRKFAPGSRFSLLDMSVVMSPAAMDAIIYDTVKDILKALCEAVHQYDCDMVLLTGRPSRLRAVINAVTDSLPVPAGRILPMCEYRVGRWYPFVDHLGMITDPKTTVSMGAILCALAEGHLEGFSFATRALSLASTARYIGEMDTTGRLAAPKVWFEPDVHSAKTQELEREIQFTGPLSVGFRQFQAERWPTTRFYLLDFSTEEYRRLAADGRLPYTVTVEFVAPGTEDWDGREEKSEGTLSVVSVVDSDGNEPRGGRRVVEFRLQTLPLDEGYWLDTGVLVSA